MFLLLFSSAVASSRPFHQLVHFFRSITITRERRVVVFVQGHKDSPGIGIFVHHVRSLFFPERFGLWRHRTENILVLIQSFSGFQRYLVAVPRTHHTGMMGVFVCVIVFHHQLFDVSNRQRPTHVITMVVQRVQRFFVTKHTQCSSLNVYLKPFPFSKVRRGTNIHRSLDTHGLSHLLVLTDSFVCVVGVVERFFCFGGAGSRQKPVLNLVPNATT